MSKLLDRYFSFFASEDQRGRLFQISKGKTDFFSDATVDSYDLDEEVKGQLKAIEDVYREHFFKSICEKRERTEQVLIDVLNRISDRGVSLHLAPVKKWERAKDKIERDYDGDPRKLLDIIRGTVVFVDMPTCRDFYSRLASSEEMVLLKLKNKFNQSGGLRHANLSLLCVETMIIVELQMHLAGYAAVKNIEHEVYEVLRRIKEPADERGQVLTRGEEAVLAVCKTTSTGIFRPIEERYATGVRVGDDEVRGFKDRAVAAVADFYKKIALLLLDGSLVSFK